jgi:hypothetical protein
VEASFIFNLCTRWMSVVSFTPGVRAPITHRIGGWVGRGGEEKEISAPAGNRPSVVQPAAGSDTELPRLRI